MQLIYLCFLSCLGRSGEIALVDNNGQTASSGKPAGGGRSSARRRQRWDRKDKVSERALSRLCFSSYTSKVHSHNMSTKLSSCCVSGHLHSGNPEGKDGQIAGLRSYITGSNDKKVLVFIPDIFGYALPVSLVLLPVLLLLLRLRFHRTCACLQMNTQRLAASRWSFPTSSMVREPH